MKALKIKVDAEILDYLCECVKDANLHAYESLEHRAIAMETRLSLGPRLFRALLKIPVSDKIAVSYREASFLEFAICMHEGTIRQDGFARIILGQIQPKLNTQKWITTN